MPEQIEQVRERCTPKINLAINAVDNGYVVQGEVQWLDGDVVVTAERRTAVARDELSAGMLAGCFLQNRAFVETSSVQDEAQRMFGSPVRKAEPPVELTRTEEESQLPDQTQAYLEQQQRIAEAETKQAAYAASRGKAAPLAGRHD